MSKDPLEELFGPLDAEPEPEPVPARRRLQQEQAERVRTAKLSTGAASAARGSAAKKASAGRPSGGERRSHPALPWIIVGLVAVVAIVISIVVVNVARAGQDETAGPERTTQTPAPTKSETSETTAPDSDDEDEDAEEAERKKDEPPEVDPGPTNQLNIPAWGVTSQLSTKFGSTSYAIPDNVNLVLSSGLIDQLPCDGDWGVTKQTDGTYTVLKPTERCEAAPELYDELWGLTAALVESIQPAG